MAINIKHKDSVTGIVLYIFNLIRQYNGIDEAVALSDLIDYISIFGKSETAIRMGLSRMDRADVVKKIKKNGNIYYKLDKDGKENLTIWDRGYKYFSLKYSYRNSNDWDKNWHSYILKEFNKSEKNNEEIIDQLEELGKGEIEYNVWTSPYDMSEKIETLLNDTDITYFNIIGKLNSNINLNNYLEKVYDLNELEVGYKRVLNMIEKNDKDIKNNTLNPLELLPKLGYTGWLFYTQVTKDPFLPKDLLSDWIGDTAVQEFKIFREKIFNRIITEIFDKRKNFDSAYIR